MPGSELQGWILQSASQVQLRRKTTRTCGDGSTCVRSGLYDWLASSPICIRGGESELCCRQLLCFKGGGKRRGEIAEWLLWSNSDTCWTRLQKLLPPLCTSSCSLLYLFQLATTRCIFCISAIMKMNYLNKSQSTTGRFSPHVGVWRHPPTLWRTFHRSHWFPTSNPLTLPEVRH